MPQVKVIDYALESDKTKKARAKLLKMFSKQEKKITPEALKLKKMEMNLWLAKYAASRITVPDSYAKPSPSLIKKVTGVIQQTEREKRIMQKYFPNNYMIKYS